MQRADELLAALRLEVPARVRAPATVGVAATPGSPLGDATPYPAPSRGGADAPRRPDRAQPRLTGASVPQILLTLGALCLLVAAVTFLAVAWTWLGIGGRTVVLLVLTVAALAGARLFAGRGLRMAGEALVAVGLGLVSLDVIGARHAGWLGHVGDAGLVAAVGSVVATVSLAMLLVTLPRPLVVPALVAPFAVLVAGVGAQVPIVAPVPMLVATLALLGLGRIGITVPSTPLWVSSLVAAGLGWLYLLVSGLGQVVTDDTVSHLWRHGEIWPLLAAVAVAAAAAPVVGLGRVPTLAGYSVAAVVGTFVVVAPALDNSSNAATVSLLLCVLVWSVAATSAPGGLRPATGLPLAGAAVLPVAVLLQLAASAVRATYDVGAPFSQPVGVHVPAPSPWVSPWLTAPILVVLAAAGCAVVALWTPVRRTTWVGASGAAAVLGAVITLPLYDVRLAAVVAVLLALSRDRVRRRRATAR